MKHRLERQRLAGVPASEQDTAAAEGRGADVPMDEVVVEPKTGGGGDMHIPATTKEVEDGADSPSGADAAMADAEVPTLQSIMAALGGAMVAEQGVGEPTVLQSMMADLQSMMEALWAG